VSEAAAGARPVRKWLRWALYFIAAVAAFAVLRDKVPSLEDLTAATARVHPGWLVAAALAETWSLGMFARQQRRLLKAFGVRMSLPYAMAVTLSRSAIAISLPAGSAISAAFAFQQFRAKGANRTVASAVMVLSGIMSFAGLAVLYLVGGAVSGIVSVCALTGASLLTGAVIFFLWRRWHPSPDGRLGRLVAAAHEVAPRHWILALVFAVVNWFGDLVCLLAVIRAFDLTIPVSAVAGTYLAVQIVRQVPLTPGGIGVIETGLLTGLVSAGASNASAAAAVLGYRVLSCWLIIPIGLIAWTVLRRPADPDATAAASEPTAVQPAIWDPAVAANDPAGQPAALADRWSTPRSGQIGDMTQSGRGRRCAVSRRWWARSRRRANPLSPRR
jgi:putative heme transporter